MDDHFKAEVQVCAAQTVKLLARLHASSVKTRTALAEAHVQLSRSRAVLAADVLAAIASGGFFAGCVEQLADPVTCQSFVADARRDALLGLV